MRKDTTRKSGGKWDADVPDVKDGREFDSLSDADKEKVYQFYDQGMHRSGLRPLNAKERALVKEQKKEMKRKAGRPQVGKGAKVISLSVEKDLLKRADALAKQRGVSRARLVAEGLSILLKSA